MIPKSKNSLFLILLVFASSYTYSQSSQEQKKKDERNSLKTWIETKKYRFQAQSATTQRGKTIQLTSFYSIKLNNDSLQVDLPYYGRAYTTQYPPTDPSLLFNTNQFVYTADTTKKGGWEIIIDKPRNSSGVIKILMNITSSGYCIVRVTSTTRDLISFYGMIRAYDEAK